MWASLPFASSSEHCLPRIQFLFIGSRFCSTLPSEPASRRRPCALLSLHRYQVVKRTFTSKLSTLLGVPKKAGRFRVPLCLRCRRIRSQRWPPPPPPPP